MSSRERLDEFTLQVLAYRFDMLPDELERIAAGFDQQRGVINPATGDQYDDGRCTARTRDGRRCARDGYAPRRHSHFQPPVLCDQHADLFRHQVLGWIADHARSVTDLGAVAAALADAVRPSTWDDKRDAERKERIKDGLREELGGELALDIEDALRKAWS